MTRASTQNILVSTTPRLQGWEIKRYHGAVSAHVVAGTNIFSDIAASWRDVFGGQSKSYKKQLKQINEAVVNELREEASQRGANALVGLKIDHDQISGQNKAMFMVTASATAVRAESRSEPSSEKGQEEEGAVTAREIGVEERTVRLLEKSREGGLSLDKETWRFLIENQIDDAVSPVRDVLTEVIERPSAPQRSQNMERGRDYFLSISEEKAREHLYDIASCGKEKVVDWAVSVLEDGDMLDIRRIEEMLGGDFYDEQKPALEILTRVDKPYYEPSDVDKLEKLKSKIEDGFEKRGEVLEVEEEGMFSSDTKKVWQIKGGDRNPMDRTYCRRTGLDIYGFGQRETRPEEAVQALEMKIKALNRRFGNN